MSNNQQQTQQRSFQVFRTVGLAIDPIHIGTGGARLGRVDNTIVRDPVTRIPKIPGSSLAGVHRAYAAMALEDERCNLAAEERERRGWGQPFYPNHAGQDPDNKNDGAGPINAVFGHRNFAGLAALSTSTEKLSMSPFQCNGWVARMPPRRLWVRRGPMSWNVQTWPSSPPSAWHDAQLSPVAERRWTRAWPVSNERAGRVRAARSAAPWAGR